MPVEHLDRLVPFLRRPEPERLCRPLPRGRRERLSRLRADDEDGRARLADRRSLDRGVGNVHERPRRGVDLLAVERERPVAGEHDVQLLVAFAARLVCSP
jgi:hypothetical protein